MIYETDRGDFITLMTVMWQSFGRNAPDGRTMHAWFNALKKYELFEVTEAFDTWLKNQTQLATISEILKICKPKVTIYARIASPLAIESNKRHATDVMTYVAKNIKPQSDYRAWTRKIIANPFRYPDISIKLAKEALETNTGFS